MDDLIADLFAKADWDALTPRLLCYADRLICNVKWRGAHLVNAPNASPSGDSFSAEDALNQAVDRFLEGKRRYQPAVDLEMNLSGAIRSIISNWNKSSNREPLVETSTESRGDTLSLNSTREAIDSASFDRNNINSIDRAAHQAAALDAFQRTIHADKELTLLFQSYTNEIYTPREIQSATGIAASRISELKRKLRVRMNNFIAAHSIAASLKRKSHARSTI